MKIESLRTHPLTVPIGDLQRTSQGSFGEISILVIEITTDDGITGFGECLARSAPKAYAELVHDRLEPRLLGADPFAVEAIWQNCFRTFTGRSGGVLIEAIAGIDIALWDIMGKALGQPIHRLLGHMGRERVTAYASSIAWVADDQAVQQIEHALARGFRQIKVKLGAPVEAALARAAMVREVAGDEIRLMADANWVFDLDDAARVARGLYDLDYFWFEEPIVPEDLRGYELLRQRVPIRLAAGESEHTAAGAAPLIASRSIGVVQPDVARSGGITETRKIAHLAHANHVAYAPHVGASGAICAAASLHLAAAMPNFLTFECMVFPNPLKDELTTLIPGDPDQVVDGGVAVPSGPGLGIEVDRTALKRMAAN